MIKFADRPLLKMNDILMRIFISMTILYVIFTNAQNMSTEVSIIIRLVNMIWVFEGVANLFVIVPKDSKKPKKPRKKQTKQNDYA